MDDSGLNRSAVLLMSLGEEEAAQVLKHLEPRDVQKLGTVMAGLKNVPREMVETVLESFQEEALNQSPLGAGGNDYLRAVLTRALGEDKASVFLDRIVQNSDASGIEVLKWMDARSAAELIADEHPQIVATILVHLERDHAAEILKALPEQLRVDVLLRIATLDSVQPAGLRELNEAMSRLIAGAELTRRSSLGGERVAADILNHMGATHEAAIMEGVREFDEELAQKILDQMFVFDNLLELDDKAIQLVLREVQSESLIVALKGTVEELREKIVKNMSQRAADLLREDLESRGPVKVSEVEAEQKEILKIVRRLVEDGQVAMGGRGADGYV
ncbi:MAG: flagellar motor switch protein FliG [Burkholderiales bacterium]|nr:flagellar motor switch protein FliG [Burkholderiales bacterium]